MIFRQAIQGDLALVQELLRASRLPTDHLQQDCTNLFLLEDERGIAGCACLCGSEGPHELRSVCIRDDLRGRGWGRHLVERMLREAEAQGIATLYLRSTIPGFFAKFGFRELRREDLPRIWAKCSDCPRRGTAECKVTPMVLGPEG